MKRSRWAELRTALIVVLAIGALRVSGCGTMEQAELRALDYRLRLRGVSQGAPEVAIVAVDNRSIEELGRWPWSRDRQAQLMERLTAAGPAVIGVDIVQSEAEALCHAPALPDQDQSCRDAVARAMAAQSGDARLGEAVRANGHTVLGYYFDFDGGGETSAPANEGFYTIVRSADSGGEEYVRQAKAIKRNLPIFSDGARSLGYFNFFPEFDGIYRRAPLAIRFGDRLATPLSLTMLAVRFPERPLSISFSAFGVESVRFGSTQIPVNRDGQMLLNWRKGPSRENRAFPHYSASDVIAGRVPDEKLRDKLVLLGVTAIAVADIRATPLEPQFPGVEIHANVIDNILRQDFLRQTARREFSPLLLLELAVLALLCFVMAFLLRFARGFRGAILALTLIGMFLAGSQWLFVESGIALRVVYPALAFGLTYIAISVEHYVVQEGETRRTRRMLDLYLSPSVASQLSEHPEMIKLGGEKSDRTVLFSDVREFTRFSERLDPHDLVELLNLYLGEMTDAVFQSDGMLDKYIGDGVMAVWSAPLPQTDHAARACHTALDMMKRLRSINERGAERNWPLMEIRIGINTGPMVFGNMGSTQHLSLTVMGDNVNLGARLEGINKLYGSNIIASESTVDATNGQFVTRELDFAQVKGRTQSVRIYEILGTADEHAQWSELLQQFAVGLAHYRAQEWQDALEAFEHCARLRPGDGPTELYLARCRTYLTRPPAAEWEPVHVFGG